MTAGSRRDLSRAVVVAGAAFGLAELTAAGRGRAFDDWLFKRVNARLRHPLLDRVFGGVTELGSIYASAGAAGALAVRGRGRAAVDALAAASTAWVLGQALKRAWRRARPFEAQPLSRLLIRRPGGASWPSSHPMVLLTFASVAARDLGAGAATRRAVGALAAAVAASRVYLGVHYPADVLGGLLLGRALADSWSAGLSPRLLR